MNVDKTTCLGVDPVRIFQSDRDTAAGIVSAIANIESREERGKIRTLIGGARDLLDVYQHVKPRLRRRSAH